MKREIARRRAVDLSKGQMERATMEERSKPKIRMLSGFYGTEKHVQNIWIILPKQMKRSEFIARFNKGFSDVGEI